VASELLPGWRVTVSTLVFEPDKATSLHLLALLKGRGGVRVIGSCETLDEARQIILERRPHLVFLGIPMLDAGPREFCRSLTTWRPLVVVMAHRPECAVQAYELEAFDFVLKPLQPQRLELAIERTRRELGHPSPAAPPADPPGHEHERPAAPDRLIVRRNGRVLIVRLADIDWVEAAGNDVAIHTTDGPIRVRQTLASIEERLRGSSLVRIHRCRLINLERVEQVWHTGEGGTVRMRGGTELRFARSFRKQLRQLLSR
jgi:two-component system LytT family response regulator